MNEHATEFVNPHPNTPEKHVFAVFPVPPPTNE
jgi:hypothetical protein